MRQKKIGRWEYDRDGKPIRLQEEYVDQGASYAAGVNRSRTSSKGIKHRRGHNRTVKPRGLPDLTPLTPTSSRNKHYADNPKEVKGWTIAVKARRVKNYKLKQAGLK